MAENVSDDFPWNIEKIREVLPHRYPFLLVDRVLKIERGPDPSSRIGEKITAIKNVSANEEFFNGHFPHRPILPGVIIMEGLAQAAGLVAYQKPADGFRNDFLIAGLDGARFRRPVVPGDQLEYRCELIKARKTLFVFDGKAYVDGVLAAEATITAYMIANPKD